MKQPVFQTLTLDNIISGGQAIGRLESGKKALVWGGLPGEKVTIQVTKKKSSYAEGIVTEIISPSQDRVAPIDPGSYLSTSPWQIMTLGAEQRHKAQLIKEAFNLHHVNLPGPVDVFTNNKQTGYRNKIEFNWWWSKESDQLDLAFFRRGSHGKIAVNGTSLAHPAINKAALALRDLLRQRHERASDLKTVIIRCSQTGQVSMQLYVKQADFALFDASQLEQLNVQGFELIYSNPQSPASVITKRLQSWGNIQLTDTVLDIPFTYAVEGFFQINLPVYEQALTDMKQWIPSNIPTVDLYSGVGSIGLTIGTDQVTLVESNEHAVREMQRNIATLDRASARAILATSETALHYITEDATTIVDPPRAGLHEAVVNQLLAVRPKRIVYLSCNPVTQARDVALLAPSYKIAWHKGYNFFPRTPHIEHLVILDLA